MVSIDLFVSFDKSFNFLYFLYFSFLKKCMPKNYISIKLRLAYKFLVFQMLLIMLYNAAYIYIKSKLGVKRSKKWKNLREK